MGNNAIEGLAMIFEALDNFAKGMQEFSQRRQTKSFMDAVLASSDITESDKALFQNMELDDPEIAKLALSYLSGRGKLDLQSALATSLIGKRQAEIETIRQPPHRPTAYERNIEARAKSVAEQGAEQVKERELLRQSLNIPEFTKPKAIRGKTFEEAKREMFLQDPLQDFLQKAIIKSQLGGQPFDPEDLEQQIGTIPPSPAISPTTPVNKIPKLPGETWEAYKLRTGAK